MVIEISYIIFLQCRKISSIIRDCAILKSLDMITEKLLSRHLIVPIVLSIVEEVLVLLQLVQELFQIGDAADISLQYRITLDNVLYLL